MRFLFYYLACFFILFVVFMSCNLSCLGLVKLAILGEKNSRGLCWELQRISWKNLFEDLLDCCFTVQSEVYRIKINAFSAHRLDFICTDNFEDSKSTILTAPFVWSGKTIVLFFCFVLFFLSTSHSNIFRPGWKKAFQRLFYQHMKIWSQQHFIVFGVTKLTFPNSFISFEIFFLSILIVPTIERRFCKHHFANVSLVKYQSREIFLPGI